MRQFQKTSLLYLREAMQFYPPNGFKREDIKTFMEIARHLIQFVTQREEIVLKINGVTRESSQQLIILIYLYKIYNIKIKNNQMGYHQKYTEKEFIGRGNYGKVYLIYQNTSLNLYVAKKISLQGLKFQQIDHTMLEIQIHKKLTHPNIIAFKESFLQDDILIIIMQYCQFGDLSIYIKNRNDKNNELFDEEIIMNLFIQLTLGVQYLHRHKIIHRDIKPQNIFINQDGVIKLADFGISKVMEQTLDKAMTLVGTPYYLSPQACKNEGYTTKSDIWSLGCVLYEMCTLKHAFEGNNVLSLANKITHDQVQPISNKFSTKLFDLIRWLLSKNPNDRPTANQILQSQYVKIYSSNFQSMQLQPYLQSTLDYNKGIEMKKEEEEYQNQFMPNFQQQYKNQFLQDEKFHPKNSTKEFQSKKNQQLSNTNTNTNSNNPSDLISPRKNAVLKLKQKCTKKMGDKQFNDVYRSMRRLKQQGLSQIEVQIKIKGKFNINDFNQIMDIAQIIYIEDNP